MTELRKAFKGKTHTKSQIDLFNEVLSSDAVASLKGARATCAKIAAEMKKMLWTEENVYQYSLRFSAHINIF